MIKITGLDKKEFVINSEHIEKLEQIPESVITLTNGHKYLVKESNDEIIRKVIEYKRKIFIGDVR
ncbi:flagellar FlbD family protein [Clostridium aciditolerans]|uniref:Flagellar FlbD family protein n=1 Tax=Clostridium aciditolerans TaxID=339861 RepID=A0A934M9G9_9CLOT|nr:flagellar FlbD family protein [Clostridium aciditolerans]MBI6875776.1 flagellar FlbD family protein [Clostridium aciditolerans]